MKHIKFLIALPFFSAFIYCQRREVPRYVLEKSKKINFPEVSESICHDLEDSKTENVNKDERNIYVSIFLIKSALDIAEIFLFANVISLYQLSSCDKGEVTEKRIKNQSGDFTEKDFKKCLYSGSLLDGKIYLSPDILNFSDFWILQKTEYIKKYILLREGKIRVIPNINYLISYAVKDFFLYSFTELSSIVSEKLVSFQGSVAIQIPYYVRLKGIYREYLIDNDIYYSIQFQDFMVRMSMEAEGISMGFGAKFKVISPYVCGDFEVGSENFSLSHLSFLSNDSCGYRGELKLNDQTIKFLDNSIYVGQKKYFCFDIFE